MREAYLFGPFRLLAHQRELFAHGVPIPVGQRAFDILLVLVSRHGHLVTKDELMAEVWPGVIVEENNIQVHISALRKVLGTDGDPKRYLVTVPGRGYRFVAPVKTESADHSAPSTAALAEQTAAAPGTVGSQQAGNNLPNQLTSLIGRETEVAEIKAELSNYRLVTSDRRRGRRQDPAGDRGGPKPSRAVPRRSVVRGARSAYRCAADQSDHRRDIGG